MRSGGCDGGGLVSLDAPYCAAQDAAMLCTKPLLNLYAGGGGSLVVEVRRAGAGEAGPALLTSAPLTHNGVELEALWGETAAWPGNATAIGELAGAPVVLTMRMQACSLYGFRFAE
eukprot:SAG22_NODE_7928_length_697_cov_0.591973_1_plen_116_part_00